MNGWEENEYKVLDGPLFLKNTKHFIASWNVLRIHNFNPVIGMHLFVNWSKLQNYEYYNLMPKHSFFLHLLTEIPKPKLIIILKTLISSEL